MTFSKVNFISAFAISFPYVFFFLQRYDNKQNTTCHNYFTKLRQQTEHNISTNRTQHVTIINFNKILYPNQVILLVRFLLQQNYKNETKRNMSQLCYLMKFNI